MNARYLLYAYLSLFFLGIGDNIRGPLYPEILSTFSLSHSVGSRFFWVTSLFSFVGGYLAQFSIAKMGYVRTLQWALLMMIFAQFGFGLSADFNGFLLMAALLGVGVGAAGVAQNVMVIKYAPAGQVQRWQSGLHSVYGGSSFLAPLLVSAVVSLSGRWQLSFTCAGLVGIMVFLLSLRGEIDRPSQADFVPLSFKVKLDEFFYAMILGVYVGFELMVSTRLAIFAKRVFSFSTAEANFLTSGFFVFLFLGRLLFVVWRPAFSFRAQLVSCLLGSIVLSLLGIWLNPWFFALVGLSMAPFFPLAMTEAGRLFPHSLARVTSYCIGFSGLFIVLMHQVVGTFSDLYGISLALLLGPVFGLLSLAFLLLFPLLFGRK